MTAKHSAILRGVAAPGRNPAFEGRFGRLFPELCVFRSIMIADSV